MVSRISIVTPRYRITPRSRVSRVPCVVVDG